MEQDPYKRQKIDQVSQALHAAQQIRGPNLSQQRHYLEKRAYY